MVSTSSEEKYSPYVETLTCRVKVFLRLREEYQFLQKDMRCYHKILRGVS